MLEFIKEKSYYLLGGTLLILIIVIVLVSCSNKKNRVIGYADIENQMVSAAKKYYEKKPKKLPQTEGNTVKVSTSTLVESELLSEIYDPKNKNTRCSGYVEVSKFSENYTYTPILTCKGSYEPRYLSEVIKESGQDEYGNGIYYQDGEYVYRGETVNNFVLLNDELWRILSIDKDGDIKLVNYPEKNQDKYIWDGKYNSDIKKSYGVTTDYFQSSIRKTLQDYYNTRLTDATKTHIVSKNICIGSKVKTDRQDPVKECSKVQENEKIGLMVVSDFAKASLGTGCDKYDQPECTNRNYITASSIRTWLLTPVADNSYEVYTLSGSIGVRRASADYRINPVVYVDKKTLISNGAGIQTDPYVIK